MRKHYTRSVMPIAALLLFIFSCAPKVVAPSEADVSRGQKKYPDLSMEQLDAGRSIFQENCNLCHGYYQPNTEPEDEWLEIVPNMVGKVNQKLGTEKISAKDQELLLRYVITMSTAAP